MIRSPFLFPARRPHRRLPGVALLAVAFACALAPRPAADAATFTLAVPGGAVRAGAVVTVQLVAINPAATPENVSWRPPLAARLGDARWSWNVELAASAPAPGEVPAHGFATWSLTLTLPPEAAGQFVLELAEPAGVRGVLDVTAGPAAPAADAVKETHVSGWPASLSDRQRLPATARMGEYYAENFSGYEPVYFVYGPDAPAAKFQFSFRYRLAAEDGWLVRRVPFLRGINFAYTQCSLWDLGGDSSPFYDTSYMPELLYEFPAGDGAGDERDGFFTWLGLHAGVRHESNGRDGADSRSMNTAFIRPAFALGDLDGWNLVVAPRIFAYVNKDRQNANIADYRGYAELRAIWGRRDGPALSLTGRVGRHFSRGAAQLDLTIPTRALGGSLATYLHLQYWTGYGESLRDYDVRSETVRAGISLVR